MPTHPTRPANGFGHWYDARQGETGDLWHRTLIDPGLLGRLGTLEPETRVLDLGCGNGYLARRLARSGARVVGVDRSAPLLAAARAREAADPLGVVYHELDAARLTPLADARFEVVLANMSLLDIEDAAGAIREAGRVCVDGGRFVFSISHPCFDVDTRSTWEVDTSANDTTVYRKVTNYRRPHSDRYVWPRDASVEAVTTGYHRPLSWYAHALRAGGWSIIDLDEPAPLPEFVGRRVQKAWLDEIPLHLVVEARREARRAASSTARASGGGPARGGRPTSAGRARRRA
jgi:SAM-dependent methyltransferase